MVKRTLLSGMYRAKKAYGFASDFATAARVVDGLAPIMSSWLGLCRHPANVTIKAVPESLNIDFNGSSRSWTKVTQLCKLSEKGGLRVEGGCVSFEPYAVKIALDRLTDDMVNLLYHCVFDEYTRNNPLYKYPLKCYSDSDFIIVLENGMKFLIPRYQGSYFKMINGIYEVFVQGEYYNLALDLKGKTVLDMGAFIGDTAIYFHSIGAERVLAYEPDPVYCGYAAENVKVNAITNVKLFNCGIGGSQGRLKAQRYGEAGEMDVDIVPLRDVLREAGGADLVKMDIEGAEFDAILSSEVRDLRLISQLVMEYHSDPAPLITKLEEAGFDVSSESQRDRSRRTLGLLCASRKDRA